MKPEESEANSPVAAANRSAEPVRRIPALVVSGFLGSGKTTLVRHLLEAAQRDGVRVAVVSNELGALGIDRALLGDGREAFIELEGGCVCCELSDDLIETLQNLYDQVRPDRIVIETSGVALPFDTQLNFWRDPVRDWIGDDMAVVVVNAEQVAEGRDLEGTFEDQVSSADLLVLNKIDLLDDAGLSGAHAALREVEPEAPIVTCVQGRLPSELLFPPSAGDVDRRGEAPAARPHHHEHFETEVVEFPAGIEVAALEASLRSQSELLRAKGFVRTDAGPKLVQVVGRRIEIEDAPNISDELVSGRVVLIRRSAGASTPHH